MTIHVFIADDHGVLRAGLRALLKADPDIDVIGEAANGDDALEGALSLRPDVVLGDISMPGLTGIELAEQLRERLPRTRVLILTMHEDGGLLQEALRAGAAGYVVKRAVETELIQALRTVAAGQLYIHEDMRWAVPAHFVSDHPAIHGTHPDQLSRQETEVLRLLARGYTSQQICEALGVDSQTVEARRGALSSKLGLRGRVELVRYAKEQGLL